MNSSLQPELCSILEGTKTRALYNTLSSFIVNSKQRTDIDQTNSAYQALIFQQFDRHRLYDGRLSTGTRFLFSLPDRCRVSRAPRNYMNYAAPWFSYPRHSVVLSPSLSPPLPLFFSIRLRTGSCAASVYGAGSHTRGDTSVRTHGQTYRLMQMGLTVHPRAHPSPADID